MSRTHSSQSLIYPSSIFYLFLVWEWYGIPADLTSEASRVATQLGTVALSYIIIIII